MTWVKTADMISFFEQNTKHMKTFEIKYACDIIKQLNFRSELSDSSKYFEWLKEQKYATHSKMANFAIRAFTEGGGAVYTEMKFEKSCD